MGESDRAGGWHGTWRNLRRVKVELRLGAALRKQQYTLEIEHGRGVSELLCTDDESFLYEFNQELRVKRKIQVSPKTHDEVYLVLQAVHDLDMDGKMEIILFRSQTQFTSKRNEGRADEPPETRLLHDNGIIILNSALQPVAHFRVSEKWKRSEPFKVLITDLNADGRPEIVSLADDAFILEFKP